MDVNIENITNYSDQELFSIMKKFNINCGPITGTTRKLYEKRLRIYLENLDKNNDSNGVNKENKSTNDKSKLIEQTNKKKTDKEQDKSSTKVVENTENRSIIKKKEKVTRQSIAEQSKAIENKSDEALSLITPIKHDKPIETPTTPHKKHEMVHVIQPQTTYTSMHGHKINFNKPDEALEEVFEPLPTQHNLTSSSKITIEKVESVVHRNDEARVPSRSSITETPVIHSHAHTHTHTHSTSDKVDSSILSNSSLYIKSNDTILKASPNMMNKFAPRVHNYGLLNESAEPQQKHSAESTLIKPVVVKPLSLTPSTEKRNSINNQIQFSSISVKPKVPLETFTTTTTSTITKQELIQIEKNAIKELAATKKAIEILDKEFVRESSPLAFTKQMLIENKINNASPFKPPSVVVKPTVLRKDPSPKRQENIFENRIIKDQIPFHVERRSGLHKETSSPLRQPTTTTASVLNDRRSVNTPSRIHNENSKSSSQLEFKLLTPQCKPATSKIETKPATSSTNSSTTQQKDQSSTDQWINYKYLAAATLATVIIYFLLIPFDFISLSLSNDDL